MQERKSISSIKAGLIIAIILIVTSSTAAFINGNGAQPGGGWISYAIIGVALMFFITLYGKSKDHNVTFGDLFSYGFKTTSMLTLVFIIFITIIAIAFPHFKEQALAAARAEMEKQKNASDSDVQKGMELMTRYFWVFIAAGTLLGFLIVGCVGSLLGAALTKKNPNYVNHPTDQLDA